MQLTDQNNENSLRWITNQAQTQPVPRQWLHKSRVRLDFLGFLDRDLSCNNTMLFTKSTTELSGRAAND